MDTIVSSDTIPEKHCTKCGKSFPETPEYFHRSRKGRISYDGTTKLKEKCKNCCSMASEKTKDREELKKRGKKRCNDCEQAFPATLEYFQSNIRRGRPNTSPFTSRCKECISKGEKANPYSKRNPKNSRRIKDKWAKEHSEQVKARCKDWRRRNQPIKNAQTRNYRAKKRDLPGTHTEEDIQKKLKAQKYCCYYAACGFSKFPKKNGKYQYHVDHTIPVARTEAHPRNDIDYLVLTCASCNQSKNKKLPIEWEGSGRLF